MKKRVLPVIISLICLSLLGIIIVQFFWIRNAWKVKEEQFNRSVNDAMLAALKKLETREDILNMRRTRMGDSIQELVSAFSSDSVLLLNSKLDSLLKYEDLLPPHEVPAPPVPYEQLYFEYNIRSFENQMPEIRHFEFYPRENITIDINGYFDLKKLDSVVQKAQRDSRVEELKAEEERRIMHKKPGKAIVHREIIREAVPPGTPDFRPDHEKMRRDIRRISDKARKIKDVIQKMALELESKPLTLVDRIDTARLQKELGTSFAENGIDIPFEYALRSSSGDSVKVPVRSKGFKSEAFNTSHRATLFSDELFHNNDQLLVFFPTKKNWLLDSISWITLASVFFTLVISITSVMSISFMLRQKKISDIKTDFINNMTHEFKTPIATISIAVDSINNPKVIEDPQRIKNYTRVIKEENNRMNTRVEQVLQMALLDSSEFLLHTKPVDVHTLLYKVTDHLRLQVEKRNGSLEFMPGAAESVVRGDDAHLSSVFLNLLDNANKYSPEKPEITVFTENEENSLIISVQDKGIGMSHETRDKIFEKFFRVSSGNIHNVKGFGLGLSYAKAIVEAHKGTISVSSEPEKGSTFRVVLPLV